MADEQRERAFYAGALVAPIVGHALLATLPSPLAGIMAMSLVYVGLPYAVWALLMFVWMRKQPIHRIRTAVLLAPVSFFIVCALIYAAFSFATAEPGNRLSSAMASAGFFAPWILGFGYLWVILILITWRVVRTKDAETRSSR
jgi:glucan phosphoethanolaminetransferase (alkaline phosphatase superfamily)